MLPSQRIIVPYLESFRRNGATLVDNAVHRVVRAKEKYRETSHQETGQRNPAAAIYFSLATHVSIVS
jgi:hypothetical protein